MMELKICKIVNSMRLNCTVYNGTPIMDSDWQGLTLKLAIKYYTTPLDES